MLTNRQEQILRIVVEAYTESGAPVGSRAIADRHDVVWAASTVRNEFAVLVSHGLLEQPHTSAGRRPTEAGYRYFVDGLLANGSRTVRSNIELKFDRREVADAIRQTTETLAEATELMALVSAPPLSNEEILRVELIALAPTKVMVVVITTSGNVTKRQFEFAGEIDRGLSQWATGYLNERLHGLPLGARMIRSRLFASDLRSRPAFVGGRRARGRHAAASCASRRTRRLPADRPRERSQRTRGSERRRRELRDAHPQSRFRQRDRSGQDGLPARDRLGALRGGAAFRFRRGRLRVGPAAALDGYDP
jgi:heat-inducible transcriptional repressor